MTQKRINKAVINNKKQDSQKSAENDMISLEEMGLFCGSATQESPSKGSKKNKQVGSTNSPIKKKQKAKFNEKVKNKKEEKSFKIKNREKTPLKQKKLSPKKSPTRGSDESSEDYESSSMHQRSPSIDEEPLQRSSPMKAYVLQGSPMRATKQQRGQEKPSPLKSPTKSPIKQSPAKKTQADIGYDGLDSQVVNNIFLSNISPPSMKAAHSLSVLSGKRAPKKYSPQKYRSESQTESASKAKLGSPQKDTTRQSPAKKKISPTKASEMMIEEKSGSKKSPVKTMEDSPGKSSPSKRRLEFSAEKENTPPSKRKTKADNSEQKEKKKNSPQKSSPKSKGSPSKKQKAEADQEEEGIDLLELINLSITHQNNAFEDMENYELDIDELNFEEFDNLPAYTLFDDEEDKQNYFNELNLRYFEELDHGKITPKRKDYDYKKVVFGKKKKIKSKLQSSSQISSKKIAVIHS